MTEPTYGTGPVDAADDAADAVHPGADEDADQPMAADGDDHSDLGHAGSDDQLDDEPVDVPAAPQTGDQGVDEAVALLREAVAGPLEGQVAAYDATHRALQDRLADVEG